MVALRAHIIQTQLKRLTAWIAVGFIACGVAFSAQAQLFAPDPCDPDYYESLEARAWLEAQREITQNQNLIFKSDSVLEYTCFDSFLSELVDHGGAPTGADKLFTATDRWGTPPPGDMSGTISNLVGSAINAYDTANFNHNLLGGRSEPGPSNPYPLPATIGAGSYTCNVMGQVWLLAKCMDFIDQASYDGTPASDHDGFFTFAEYAADPEKRFLPTACANTVGGANKNSQLFTDNTNIAVVNGPAPNTPWDEDNVVTYYGLIYPPAGANVCGQEIRAGAITYSSSIATGLIVERSAGVGNSNITRWGEKICVVPGCYFEPTGAYVPASGTSYGEQPGRCCSYKGGGEPGCPS